MIEKEEKNKGFRKKNKKNFWKTLFLFFSFLFLFLFFPFFVQGGEEIKLIVSPELFELRVERGEVLEKKIKILNKSEVAIPLEVSVINFGAEDESGTIIFFEEPGSEQIPELKSEEFNEESFNPRKWIKIENPNFILNPQETREIRLKMEVPQNAEPGGHYAVILFEPRLPSFYFEEDVVRAIPKIGVLVLFSIEVKGATRLGISPTVVEFAIPEHFHLKRLENFLASFVGIFTEVQALEQEEFSIVEISHLPFTLRIKNNDIIHIKPQGRLVILKDNGKIIGETVISQTTILPGKIRKFPVEFKPDLPEKLEKYLPGAVSDFVSHNWLWGKYRAHLLLTANNDTIEKEIEFWVFPWRFGLFTGFSLVLILCFLLKYKKRIKLALKILVRR